MFLKTRCRARHLKAAVVVVSAFSVLGVAGIGVAAENTRKEPVSTRAEPGDLIPRRNAVIDALKAIKLADIEGFSVGVNAAAGKIGVHVFVKPGSPTAVVAGAIKLGADVTVTVVEGAPEPFLNVSGGSTITTPSGGNCTAGFGVKITAVQQGFVTAGHCFTHGQPATAQTFTVGSLPGKGHSFVVGGSASQDWGVIAINGAPGQNTVTATVDNTLTVKGSVAPVVGTAICKFGDTTGSTCGKVTLTNTMATFRELRDAQKVLVRPAYIVNDAFMTDACMEPGDSGGPTYTAPAGTNINAMGINTGGGGKKIKLANGSTRTECWSKHGSPNVSYHHPLSRTPVGGAITLLTG